MTSPYGNCQQRFKMMLKHHLATEEKHQYVKLVYILSYTQYEWPIKSSCVYQIFIQVSLLVVSFSQCKEIQSYIFDRSCIWVLTVRMYDRCVVLVMELSKFSIFFTHVYMYFQITKKWKKKKRKFLFPLQHVNILQNNKQVLLVFGIVKKF